MKNQSCYFIEEQSSLANLSLASSRQSNERLIAKILQLEGQLYQANIENQDLRQKQMLLEHQFNDKKDLLLDMKISSKAKSVSKLRKGDSSRRFVSNLESARESPTAQDIKSLLSCNSWKQSPRTQQQTCEESSKENFSEESTISKNSSCLLSPRTTGIRKNIKSFRPSEDAQNSRITFKTIDELWNQKGESFLKKKGPQKSHLKKKSYLN